MRKSDLFRDYLEEKGFHYYEGTDDEVGTRGFVIEQRIEGGQTLTIIFEFPEHEEFLEIRIINIATIDEPSKQDELLRLINELNLGYIFGKFFIRNQGEVVVTCPIFTTDYFEPAFVKNMAALLLESIEKEYPKFMKLQWT